MDVMLARAKDACLRHDEIEDSSDKALISEDFAYWEKHYANI